MYDQTILWPIVGDIKELEDAERHWLKQPHLSVQLCMWPHLGSQLRLLAGPLLHTTGPLHAAPFPLQNGGWLPERSAPRGQQPLNSHLEDGKAET
jgi:hypothetical protein